MKALLLLTLAATADFVPPPTTTKVIGIKVHEQLHTFIFVTSTGGIKITEADECFTSRPCIRIVGRLATAHQKYILKF